MLIIVTCLVAVAAGLLAAARWGGDVVEAPARRAATSPPTAAELVRRYVWWIAVATAAALGSGLFAGVAGRLVMRLLAATSPEAQGRITDAGEVVGVISLDGTLALIVFGGLAAGGLAVVPYLLLRRWLPPGYPGGAVYGILLLLLVGPRLDPLRPDNIDFVILGPDWLAVLSFGALAIAFGVLLAALAARFGRSLPLLPTPLVSDWSGWAHYWPLVFVLAVFPLAGVLIVVGAVVALVGPRLSRGRATMSSHRLVLAGRVAIVLVAALSLPGFVSAMDTILSS